MQFFGLAGFVLYIYCIIDALLADESLIRNLPKVLWVLIVLFFPVVGSIAWLVAGRPANASFRPGDTSPRPGQPRRALPPHPSTRQQPSRPAVGPEDSPDFMRTIEQQRLRQWEEELRRREEELRRREQGEP